LDCLVNFANFGILRKEFVHAFRQVPGDIIVLASVGKIRPDFGATRSARGT